MARIPFDSTQMVGDPPTTTDHYQTKPFNTYSLLVNAVFEGPCEVCQQCEPVALDAGQITGNGGAASKISFARDENGAPPPEGCLLRGAQIDFFMDDDCIVAQVHRENP